MVISIEWGIRLVRNNALRNINHKIRNDADFSLWHKYCARSYLASAIADNLTKFDIIDYYPSIFMES